MWCMESSSVQGGQCQQRKEEGAMRQRSRPQVVEEGTIKKLTAKWLTTALPIACRKCSVVAASVQQQSNPQNHALQPTPSLLPLSSWPSSQVPANSSSLLACCKVPCLACSGSLILSKRHREAEWCAGGRDDLSRDLRR